MTKTIRIAIVVSCFWIAGVFTWAGIEFLSILPGQCIVDGKPMPEYLTVDSFFYSCNMFTDLLIHTQWWGFSVLHWNNQIIALNPRRFVFLLLGPLAAYWVI